MKAVQKKNEKDVARLIEPKTETEDLLKKSNDSGSRLRTKSKRLQKLTKNRATQTAEEDGRNLDNFTWLEGQATQKVTQTEEDESSS